MRELIETVLLIAAIYAFVNLATARFVVDGPSMQPNFETDQFIIVSRLPYILGDLQRGDVVVFHYDEKDDYIKRVIGLPGETVTLFAGRVYINGRLLDEPYIKKPYVESMCRNLNQMERCQWVIAPDEYFLLGDNRNSSRDSQDADVGPIQRERIVGRAFIRYWPPSDWGLIEHPRYQPDGPAIPTATPTPLYSPTPLPTPAQMAPAPYYP